MQRRIVILVVVLAALAIAWAGYHRYQDGVAYREKARFWELVQKQGAGYIKADEEAELDALRRRVGEREADRPGRPPH